MSLTGFGARSLVPDESLEPYAPDALLPDGALLRAGFPMAGRVVRIAAYPSPAVIAIHVGISEFPEQARRILIWQAAYDAVIGGIGRTQDTGLGLGILLHPNPAFVFRWRILAGSGPWFEVPGEFLSVSLSTAESTLTDGARVVGQVKIEDRRRDPTDSRYDATAPDLPATDDIIEFFLIGPIAPDPLHPVLVEGITAGEFCVNAYAGLYSARDPVTGAVIPTGIQYDAAAFAQMTDPVRIRLDRPIEDLRDWLETHIYAPTGWVPALDDLGRISPVSQVPPTDTSTLTVIDDAMTEPSPDWDAGQRIINVVLFTYPRDYSIGKPDPPPPTLQVVRQNLLDEATIVEEYKNEMSILRYGRQEFKLDGSAFRAVGRDPDLAEEPYLPVDSIPVPRALPPRRSRGGHWEAPVTTQPLVRTGVHVLPVSGDIEDETAWQLARDRGTYLLERYAFRAPTVQINVMRAGIPDVRCGSWVLLDLKQFPDYITQRRGLFALGQVISVGELDCAWRRLLVEIVNPILTS